MLRNEIVYDDTDEVVVQEADDLVVPVEAANELLGGN